MEITTQEKKEEINRLEERSLTFLKLFSIFWGTIIFFIIQQSQDNYLAGNIAKNFVKATLNSTNAADGISNILFYILIFIISSVIIVLSRNSVSSILGFKNRRNPLDAILKEKYKNLMDAMRYGFLASILLVIYLIYLVFIENPDLIKNLESLNNNIVFVVTVIIFTLGPIYSFFKFIKKWNFKSILKRIVDVFSFVVGINYYMIEYGRGGFIVIKPGISSEIFTLFLIIVIFYNLFRFLPPVFKKIKKTFNSIFPKFK